MFMTEIPVSSCVDEDGRMLGQDREKLIQTQAWWASPDDFIRVIVIWPLGHGWVEGEVTALEGFEPAAVEMESCDEISQ